MRQAGRSSAAYRAIRAKHGILEIAKSPALAAEVTLQPVHELEVDAAIHFADLLLPLEAMGVRVRIDAGEGPVIERPIRTPEDLDRLKPLDPERDLSFVFETIRRARANTAVPCIGVGGAPFTMASHLIEGGPSKGFAATKILLHNHPLEWRGVVGVPLPRASGGLLGQGPGGARSPPKFST